MIGARALQLRRARLVARSVALRGDIAAAAGSIGTRAVTVERVLAVVHRHRLVTTLAAVALAAVVARPSLAWLRRALTIYALLRSITRNPHPRA